MAVMLLIVGAIGGGLYWFSSFAAGKKAAYFASVANPPQTISAIKVTKQSWQASLSAVGSLRAVNGTDLALRDLGHRRDAELQLGATTCRQARFWRRCAPMTRQGGSTR